MIAEGPRFFGPFVFYHRNFEDFLLQVILITLAMEFAINRPWADDSYTFNRRTPS